MTDPHSAPAQTLPPLTDASFFVSDDSMPAQVLDVSSTALTAGPWSSSTQHGGPPSALLAAAFEAHARELKMSIARITVELPSPVPVGPLTVHSAVTRAGSKTAILDGHIQAGDKIVMRARARALHHTPHETPAINHERALPPLPITVQGGPAMRGAHPHGYLAAMEWRFPHPDGSFDELGPGQVWARQRVPLLNQRPDSCLTRVLVLADSNWAAAFELDHHSHLIVNIDLTVTMVRESRSEWLALDSRTLASPNGFAAAAGVIHDDHGPVAIVNQTLLIAPRQTG